jgi:hypothetical protein
MTNRSKRNTKPTMTIANSDGLVVRVWDRLTCDCGYRPQAQDFNFGSPRHRLEGVCPGCHQDWFSAGSE